MPITGPGTGAASGTPAPVSPSAGADHGGPVGAAGTAPGTPVTVSVIDASTSGCLHPNGTLEFAVTVANPAAVDYPSVAPIVTADQYPGGNGPEKILAATLEQRDTATGAWQRIPLPSRPEKGALIAATWPGLALPHGGTVTVRYRLTLRSNSGAGSTALHLFALDESGHRILARVTRSVCITS
jgi:hypothetical protein